MGDGFDWEDLSIVLEQLSPSSLAAHLDADRPYDGQPHTDTGERVMPYLAFDGRDDCPCNGDHEAYEIDLLHGLVERPEEEEPSSR